MSTVRLRFRPSSVPGKEGTLYYQVIHFRKVAMLSTDYHIYADEWDGERNAIRVADSTGCDGGRTMLLQLYASRVNWKISRMREIITDNERESRRYTMEELLRSFRELPSCISLFVYVRSLIDKKLRMGCHGTAKTYVNALRSFGKFREGKDLSLDAMNGELMEAYEAWMLHTGLKRNSAVCYLRTLRTLYRQAVDEHLVEDRDLFRKVHVTVGKTRKRAVPIGVIRSIRHLDLSDHPALDFARSIFLFSFYTRGMSFVDIAHLRKSDLHNGLLTYNRRKTFQSLTVQWERVMQDIVDKYEKQTDGSPYLFPILTGTVWSDRLRYEQALQRVNRNLKRIGGLVGLSIPLTTYVARHSWASIARSMNVPISVISEGLGHDSDHTTQVYLNSLDTSLINKANRKIIREVTSRKPI